MGIINFIKSGFREVMIARPDDKKDLVVYRHPDQTIPMYSQLTVGADEVAVFYRDGTEAAVLKSAGVGQRHTLTAENIPFLSPFIDWATGGNIWVTHLFFVTTRPTYNQPFGGELGSIEDPLLGELVTPRIFGTFSFEITDPVLFISKYLGLRSSGSNDDVLAWIRGLLVNCVRSVMGQVLIEQQTSFLQLMSKQLELSARFAENTPELSAIGVKVLSFGQFDVNLSPEDKDRLTQAQAEIGAAKRKARVAHIGVAQAAAEAQARQFQLDQQFGQDTRYVRELAGNYQTYAAGQALMGAGKGMAQGGGGGGAMLGGAELGVGIAMAQQLVRGAGSAGVAAPPAAPASAPSGVTCPACAKAVPAGKFCADCGTSLAPKQRFCAQCGTEGTLGARFCASCGTAFGQEA